MKRVTPMPSERFIAKFSARRLGLCMLFVAGCSGFAHAAGPGSCSNETLRGGYAFTITGQILTPPPKPALLLAWRGRTSMAKAI